MENKVEQIDDKTPLQKAVERVLEKAKSSTPEEKVRGLQRSGILDENGRLTAPYAGLDKILTKAG